MGSGGLQLTRIAVLGGGAAAMAAVYDLTKRGGYDITVYQMGWRLGGKCATGRRMDDGRAQEHGLHVLGGFYHNAMGLLREVYDAWPGCSSHALKFNEAFEPHSIVHVMEVRLGRRDPVRFPFPENTRPLGRDPQDLNLLTIAEQLLAYVFGLTQPDLAKPRGAEYAHEAEFQESLKNALAAASREALIASRRSRGQDAFAVDLSPIQQTLHVVQRPRIGPVPPPQEQEPDYGILFEIALVVALGVLSEGLWWKGFDAANDVEFTAWMTKHGLSQRARESAYFRCGYDYAFAYVDGDPTRPTMAAGTGLRGFLRMVFTYNTSVFVHMNGGMGEIIFAPLYEVLKSRGVKFKFFHRIDTIELDEAGIRLQRIGGTVQNEPIAADYDPLRVYQPGSGAPRVVWPDGPITERLRHPISAAERPEFRYESPWFSDTAGRFELVADDDFDACILAIPVGALPDLTRDLAAKIPDWAAMLDGSATTPTLSAQLWQPETTEQLGWPNGRTILTANAPPLSTWADMSPLLSLEKTRVSQHLSYFCGPVEKAFYQLPPNVSDYGPPELHRADATTRQWFAAGLASVLPKAVPPVADRPGAPDELYVRTNSFPSELYVLTVPGAVNLRLAPGGSFSPNLYLAGDWTRNGYDIGSFETAILSGLQCARAVAGTREPLTGDQDRAW